MWGSAVSSPIGAWSGAPEANAFCVEKAPKTTQKKAGLLNSSYIVDTCAMHVFFHILIVKYEFISSVRTFKNMCGPNNIAQLLYAM